MGALDDPKGLAKDVSSNSGHRGNEVIKFK
jgi:predicted transport protein